MYGFWNNTDAGDICLLCISLRVSCLCALPLPLLLLRGLCRGDDLVKDLAALFLAEQFYGVLKQLRRKLLDNGGGIGIVKQLLDGKLSEIHGNTPFRYCGELPCGCLHYSLHPTKRQEIDRQAFI